MRLSGQRSGRAGPGRGGSRGEDRPEPRRLVAVCLVALAVVGAGCDDGRTSDPSAAVRGFAPALSLCGAFAPFLRAPEEATMEARLAAEAARLAIADGTAFAKTPEGADETSPSGPAALLRRTLGDVATACSKVGPVTASWSLVEPCAEAVTSLEGALPQVGALVGTTAAFPRSLADWTRPREQARAEALRQLRDEPGDPVAAAFADETSTPSALDALCREPPPPRPLPEDLRDDPAMTSMAAALRRRSAQRCTAWLGFRVTGQMLSSCGGDGEEPCPRKACALLAPYRKDPAMLPVTAKGRLADLAGRCDERGAPQAP